MRSFSSTQPPKQELETDRYEIKAGMLFIITDIVLVPSSKYERVGKINGYDLITKDRLKFRTTSKTLCDQLDKTIKEVGVDSQGKLKEEVKVGVKSEKSQKGPHTYLSFYDP